VIICLHDRVAVYSDVFDHRELIQLVKNRKIIDQVVLYREHIQLGPSLLVGDVSDSIFIKSQSLQIRKPSELVHLIPTFNAVLL